MIILFHRRDPKNKLSESWPCYKLGYDITFICPKRRDPLCLYNRRYRLNSLFTLALQPGSNCYRYKEIQILKKRGIYL